MQRSDCYSRRQEQMEEWETVKNSRRCAATIRPAMEEVLDLHGLSREKAIRAFTLFLERTRTACTTGHGPRHVTVITGSGKHSTHGPVLRCAIEAVLKKRGMSYKLNYGKGSFHVDVTSGMELFVDHSGQLVDSKVLLVSNLTPNPGRMIERSYSGQVSATAATPHRLSNYRRELEPLPIEVAQDDKLLYHVKRMSNSEAVKEHSVRVCENAAFHKALLLSNEEQRARENEEESLQSLLLQSAEEAAEEEESKNYEMELVMQRISTLSMTEFSSDNTLPTTSFEHDMEHAIQQSLLFIKQQPPLRFENINVICHENDESKHWEEDTMLKQAITLSLMTD